MLVLNQLRARRDAWSTFAWICLGVALMLTIMPGDFSVLHALGTLIGAIALLAVAGAVLMALGVLRRERRVRDAVVALLTVIAGILVLLTVLA